MSPASQPAAVAAVVALVLISGLTACDRDEEGRVPVACKSGQAALRSALANAPREVRLEGTRLSDCLTRSSDTGDLQEVGTTWVTVASELVRSARTDKGDAETNIPTSATPLQRLGYLVGAARRGASRTQGIHDELVRRLEQELVPVATRSVVFRESERAGRTGG